MDIHSFLGFGTSRKPRTPCASTGAGKKTGAAEADLNVLISILHGSTCIYRIFPQEKNVNVYVWIDFHFGCTCTNILASSQKLP